MPFSSSLKNFLSQSVDSNKHRLNQAPVSNYSHLSNATYDSSYGPQGSSYHYPNDPQYPPHNNLNHSGQGQHPHQQIQFSNAATQDWHRPPPPQNTYLQRTQSHGQPQSYCQPQNAGHLTSNSPSQGPRTLRLEESGHRLYSFVDPYTGQPRYTFQYAKKPTVRVTRGSNGPECGSAYFHTMTSSKADLTVSGRQTKLKKQFESTTGLGQLEWKKQTKGFFSSKGSLILNDYQGVIAVFHLNKGPESHSRQGGNLEVQKQGLSQPQLDEVFISGVVELERRRILVEGAVVAAAVT